MLLDNMMGLVGNTPLVGIQSFSPNPNVRIWAKLEGQNPTGSVKDRVALAMIEKAEAEGLLTPDKILLEPTSGNTGISLAFLARQKGYRLVCVMPETASKERAQMIKMFGGDIVMSKGVEGSNGAIRLAKQMVEEDSKYLMLYQYGNDANPGAHYDGTGPEILRDLPTVSHFVAGLGTGGTLTGVGKFFRDRKPEVRIIAAEPEQGDLVYGLRSLDDGFIPPVLDESVLHGKIKVNSNTSVRFTQDLVAQEGVFAGISCGATVYVAQKIATRIESGDIVCLFADGGWKYLSTDIWDIHHDIAAKRVEYMPW
ncbi:MAG TPA: cysteine synthase family protein [Actinomycetota bacterium]|jgi:[CysO sulfur-carrier protein]-thiocarboxylate-dependent cysteine synthase|nr:cysteine synthase family protein [Actinomycetota bacterium]